MIITDAETYISGKRMKERKKTDEMIKRIGAMEQSAEPDVTDIDVVNIIKNCRKILIKT